MTTKTLDHNWSKSEQRLLLPGRYTWQQFKPIQFSIKSTGVRISYLDGQIELMTISEEHEMFKTIIGSLIELFFLHKRIEFIPVGSATREAEEKGASFEPDESYYIGEKKDNPDLAIEVILSSGNLKKLEKYQLFKIREVWFWEKNELSIYHLEGEDYEKINSSKILPDLDIKLLVRCIQMSSKLEAMSTFIKAL